MQQMFIPTSENTVITGMTLHMWLEGCPKPYKMEQSWRCTLLELYPYEYKMSIKEKIHHLTTKLPCSEYSQLSLDVPDRPCMLACSSEDQ